MEFVTEETNDQAILADVNMDSSEELKNFVASIGAQVYALFMKTNIAPECTPDKWKAFEHDLVKYIYTHIGVEDVDDRLCSMNAFVAAFIESLTATGLMQQALDKANAELETLKNEKDK